MMNKPQKEKRKSKMIVYLFPLILIIIYILAAIVYLYGKDYKKAVYWLAAAVLNICVTF